MAMAGFTGFNILFYFASLETSAVNVGILQGAVPVFVMLGAFVAHGTRVGALQAVGRRRDAGRRACWWRRGARPGRSCRPQVNRGDLVMLVACVALCRLRRDAGRPAAGAGGGLLHADGADRGGDGRASGDGRGGADRGYRLPTAEGWVIVAYVGALPVLPRADLLPARGRPDRAGPRRRLHQPGAGLRRGDGRRPAGAGVRRLPRAGAGRGDRRHRAGAAPARRRGARG